MGGSVVWFVGIVNIPLMSLMSTAEFVGSCVILIKSPLELSGGRQGCGWLSDGTGFGAPLEKLADGSVSISMS